MTDDLATFLLNGHATAIPPYTGTIPFFNGNIYRWFDKENNDKWTKYLHSHNIMPGDLVFYDDGSSGFKWEHVTVMIGWGPQTYYGDASVLDQEFPDAVYSALYWWMITGCPTWEWKPRVVDRSGRVQYNSSRSIDNTSSPINEILILHINR